MRCEDVAELLPSVVSGDGRAGRDVIDHVDECLRCQAEAVQYRRLLRSLRNLRTEVLEPSPGLVSDVLARIEAAGERGAIRSMLTGHRAAYIGGIAVATAAAGAAAGVLIVTRARRGKPGDKVRLAD